VDRIKKLSMEILETSKEKFSTDFRENKKILDDIAIVRSKGLKNQLAGFITRFIKREIRQNEEKLAKEAQAGKEESTSQEQLASINKEEPPEETETASENKSEELSTGN